MRLTRLSYGPSSQILSYIACILPYPPLSFLPFLFPLSCFLTSPSINVAVWLSLQLFTSSLSVSSFSLSSSLFCYLITFLCFSLSSVLVVSRSSLILNLCLLFFRLFTFLFFSRNSVTSHPSFSRLSINGQGEVTAWRSSLPRGTKIGTQLAHSRMPHPVFTSIMTGRG